MRKEFYTGHLFDVYRYFGAHKEGENFIFRVFAPSAKGVCVFGEFSNWTEIPMYQEGQSGVYVSEPIPAKTGQLYKYCIYTANGGRVEHCDPYGFQMELRPGDCSILTDLYSYKFKDEKWMKNRTVGFDSPVNIYEIHAGSWRKKGEGQTDWYTYIELAKLLIPYVKKNHYTHIEMMPLSEHPFDGSWGYQNTGFFAPTARYGTPDELKKFVDECHQAGIGVIMDFVPVHFAVDYYGLKEFDGTCLYEYPNAAVGESEWGSCNFMHSRGEVRCFLQSAANYWLSEFHFDGIRMDAVSRLIYWQGDEARGVNGTTLDFLKVMNQGLKSLHPTAMLIAEDSTNFPGVTKPVDEQAGITRLGENHVFYLRYLMRERSPHNDPSARAAFIGMSMDSTREDMTQAVLEGVAFGLRDSLEVARSIGVNPERTKICGGGAKSPLWRKIIANVMNMKVDLIESEEGPGYGAAILAAVGCGVFDSVEEAAKKLVKVTGTEEPDPELVQKYEERYQEFKKLYPALKGFFQEKQV